jgi:hypothetical protein
MDVTTGSSEAVGDHGASSRRVVNGDDAADRCAARRGATDGGRRLAAWAQQGKPCVRQARQDSVEAITGLPWASREGCREGYTRRAAPGHRTMADWPGQGIGRGRRRRESMREGVDAHHADVLRSTTARSNCEGEFAETSASRCRGARELAGRPAGYRTTLPCIAAGRFYAKPREWGPKSMHRGEAGREMAGVGGLRLLKVLKNMI